MNTGQIPNDKLLQDLKRVIAQTGCATMLNYDLYGIYSHKTIVKRFGKWNQAVELSQVGK